MDQLREDLRVWKCPPYQFNFQNTSSSIQTDYKHTVLIKVGWVLKSNSVKTPRFFWQNVLYHSSQKVFSLFGYIQQNKIWFHEIAMYHSDFKRWYQKIWKLSALQYACMVAR